MTKHKAIDTKLLRAFKHIYGLEKVTKNTKIIPGVRVKYGVI
jgi:hypothetical protein